MTKREIQKLEREIAKAKKHIVEFEAEIRDYQDEQDGWEKKVMVADHLLSEINSLPFDTTADDTDDMDELIETYKTDCEDNVSGCEDEICDNEQLIGEVNEYLKDIWEQLKIAKAGYARQNAKKIIKSKKAKIVTR